MKNRPLIVWILDGGQSGHLSQSQGFASFVGKTREMDIFTIKSTLKIRGFFYKTICFLIDFFGLSGQQILNFVYRSLIFPNKKPDIIISSGDKTTLISVVLSKHFKVPNIFLGYRNNLPVRNFFKAITYNRNSTENTIYCPILFNPIRLDKIQLAAQEYFQNSNETFLVLLFGGSSRSHAYTKEDLKNLCNFMNSFSQKTGLKWLITTSRRTGGEIEEWIESFMNEEAVAEMVLYSANPKKVVQPFLGSAKMVFCSQDSLSMISESIMSQKKVYTFYPNKIIFRKKDFIFTDFLQNAKYEKFIKSISMNNLDKEVLEDDKFQKVDEDIFDKIIIDILSELALHTP